ncbi:hypothetical protein ACIRPK_34030 [Kitasatospora sp. NPDC101801]|uniref:hypothetical protein n=1 Tax=Kitasatospora sp. NPDC101801 TaxID=3364103 RepID=UPI0037FD849E
MSTMVGWLRRTPVPGSRRSVRVRSLAYLRQQGKGGPTLREVAPALGLVLALLAVTFFVAFTAFRALGLGGVLVALVLAVALASAVSRRRATIARRRSGLYTGAELGGLTDGHALARAVSRMLRRDGWRVRSLPWAGSPRLMARDLDGRHLEVTVRPADSAGEATPAPALLRRAGTGGHGGILRLVVSLGRYSRKDVLWASRQGGVFLLDGQQLAAWGGGADLVQLVGPLPLPGPAAADDSDPGHGLG